MPATYNGIGTTYYGKSNVESRTGTCRSCNRDTTLISYDTRLWFVVVFIPVIPLGRKRIIDYCSACTRHYVVDLGKWETSKQLEISAALDKFRSGPTHENAIAVHQQLLKFHQTAQADEFQKEMLEKFGQHAKVLCYLGATLEHRGLQAQAEPLFVRALQLRPDLPDARVGVAMKAIRDGRLAEATTLLDFLDKPGAAQLYPLAPLETLGNALQKSGDHQNALRMYKRLLEELPQIAEHQGFRKRVKESEKAVRQTSTILPKTKFSLRRFLGTQRNPSNPSGPVLTKRGLLIGGGIAAVVAILMAVANANIRAHRPVYFLNGLAEPENLVIDGEKKLTLRPNRPQEVVLAEGSHVAVATGPINKKVNFEVKAQSYFSRWFDKPIWIVNPDATACLLYQVATYSKNPQPPRNDLLFGREVHYLPAMSNPFNSLPQSVTVSSSSEERTLQHVEVVPHAVEGFYYLQNVKRTADAMRMAEARLRLVPGEDDLLRAYLEGLKTEKDKEQARKLLESRLTFRPVQTEWHRAYQDLNRREHRPELLALYESFLEKDPTNSALLYLRGRADSDDSKSTEYFNKAIQTDPRNAFAYYALAYRHWNHGDWLQAKPLLARAVEFRPRDLTFWKVYNLSRFGSGDLDSLQRDLRDRLAKDPLDVMSAMELLELYAVQSRPLDAESLIKTFTLATRRDDSRKAGAMETFLRGHFLYAFGQFAELEQLCSKDQSPTGRAHLFQALLEQGKIAEAEKARPSDSDVEDGPIQLLTFSLASRLAGDIPKSKQLFDRAVKTLQGADNDFKEAGALLASEQAPTDAQIFALSVPLQSKLVLAAILQFQHPSDRARFSQVARKLNVERVFPYHLIERSASSQ